VRFDQSHLTTHVNAATLLLSGGKLSSGAGGSSKSKKGKGGKSKTTEENKPVGNEGNVPWMKQMVSRNVEIHTVETTTNAAFLTTSAVGANTYSGFYFTISMVNDFSSFSALFDQYKINLIEVLIEPQVSEVTTVATDVGEYYSVVDIDDATAPTVLADMGSYPSVVQTRGTQSHYHRWVPTVAVAVYSGAFTSFAATTSMWLDCGSSSIQHYGLKGGSGPASVAQTYTYQARLHCSWRARH